METVLDEKGRGRNNYTRNNRGNYSNNDNRNNNFQQHDNQNVEVTLNTGNAEGHIETTAFSKKVCYSCGYPNHTGKNCEMRERSSHEVDRFRSTRSQKTSNATHVRQSTNFKPFKFNALH